MRKEPLPRMRPLLLIGTEAAPFPPPFPAGSSASPALQSPPSLCSSISSPRCHTAGSDSSCHCSLCSPSSTSPLTPALLAAADSPSILISPEMAGFPRSSIGMRPSFRLADEPSHLLPDHPAIGLGLDNVSNQAARSTPALAPPFQPGKDCTNAISSPVQTPSYPTPPSHTGPSLRSRLASASHQNLHVEQPRKLGLRRSFASLADRMRRRSELSLRKIDSSDCGDSSTFVFLQKSAKSYGNSSVYQQETLPPVPSVPSSPDAGRPSTEKLTAVSIPQVSGRDSLLIAVLAAGNGAYLQPASGPETARFQKALSAARPPAAPKMMAESARRPRRYRSQRAISLIQPVDPEPRPRPASPAPAPPVSHLDSPPTSPPNVRPPPPSPASVTIKSSPKRDPSPQRRPRWQWRWSKADEKDEQKGLARQEKGKRSELAMKPPVVAQEEPREITQPARDHEGTSSLPACPTSKPTKTAREQIGEPKVFPCQEPGQDQMSDVVVVRLNHHASHTNQRPSRQARRSGPGIGFFLPRPHWHPRLNRDRSRGRTPGPAIGPKRRARLGSPLDATFATSPSLPLQAGACKGGKGRGLLASSEEDLARSPPPLPGKRAKACRHPSPSPRPLPPPPGRIGADGSEIDRTRRNCAPPASVTSRAYWDLSDAAAATVPDRGTDPLDSCTATSPQPSSSPSSPASSPLHSTGVTRELDASGIPPIFGRERALYHPSPSYPIPEQQRILTAAAPEGTTDSLAFANNILSKYHTPPRSTRPSLLHPLDSPSELKTPPLPARSSRRLRHTPQSSLFTPERPASSINSRRDPLSDRTADSSDFFFDCASVLSSGFCSAVGSPVQEESTPGPSPDSSLRVRASPWSVQPTMATEKQEDKSGRSQKPHLAPLRNSIAGPDKNLRRRSMFYSRRIHSGSFSHSTPSHSTPPDDARSRPKQKQRPLSLASASVVAMQPSSPAESEADSAPYLPEKTVASALPNSLVLDERLVTPNKSVKLIDRYRTTERSPGSPSSRRNSTHVNQSGPLSPRLGAQQSVDRYGFFQQVPAPSRRQSYSRLFYLPPATPQPVIQSSTSAKRPSSSIAEESSSEPPAHQTQAVSTVSLPTASQPVERAEESQTVTPIDATPIPSAPFRASPANARFDARPWKRHIGFSLPFSRGQFVAGDRVASSNEAERARDARRLHKEVSRLSKWAQMAAGHRLSTGKILRRREPTMKPSDIREAKFDVFDSKLVQRVWKGIPDDWRAAAWYSFLDQSVIRRWKQTAQHQGVSPIPTSAEELAQFDDPGKPLAHDRLVELFHDYIEKPAVDDRQIDLDMPRTIPEHASFQHRFESGQKSMFLVLHALSLYAPETGYVQGMALLAATLLFYYSESDAFVMMARIWHIRGLGWLYQSNLANLPVVSHSLVEDWLKGTDVNRQMEGLDIQPLTYCSRWYLPWFSHAVQFPSQLRIWDVIMLLGDPDVATKAGLKVDLEDITDMSGLVGHHPPPSPPQDNPSVPLVMRDSLLDGEDEYKMARGDNSKRSTRCTVSHSPIAEDPDSQPTGPEPELESEPAQVVDSPRTEESTIHQSPSLPPPPVTTSVPSPDPSAVLQQPEIPVAQFTLAPIHAASTALLAVGLYRLVVKEEASFETIMGRLTSTLEVTDDDELMENVRTVWEEKSGRRSSAALRPSRWR